MRVAGYRPRPPREVAPPAEPPRPLRRWEIVVRKYAARRRNRDGMYYEWYVESEKPATVYGANLTQVGKAVDEMFEVSELEVPGAISRTTHVSHDFVVVRVDEEVPR